MFLTQGLSPCVRNAETSILLVVKLGRSIPVVSFHLDPPSLIFHLPSFLVLLTDLELDKVKQIAKKSEMYSFVELWWNPPEGFPC